MPRKLPTQQVDILGKPDSSLQHDVRKFIESRKENSLYRCIKTPIWDSVGESLEEFYLSARMEYNAMMRQRKNLIEHRMLQHMVNKSRERGLHRSLYHLRSRFVTVNRFLREFREKRSAAGKEGLQELATHREIQALNSKILCDLNKLFKFRKEIKATSDEYEQYETVLDNVVKQSPSIKSVKELMDRCDSLMLAQTEIVELDQLKIRELETMRKRLIFLANQAALQILGLKNVLSSVDRVYESARSETLKWEKFLIRANTAALNGDLKKCRTYDGVNHMYLMLCHRRSLNPTLHYFDVKQRLDFIKSEVELLKAVLNEIHEERNVVDKSVIMC